jgi:hypothetical protein
MPFANDRREKKNSGWGNFTPVIHCCRRKNIAALKINSMKKSFLFRMFSVIALSFVLLAGCKKENLAGGNHSTSSLISGDMETGGITGAVLPTEANPSIILRGNSVIKLAVAANGTINKNIVPAGLYTLQIEPGNPAYTGYVINDLQVIAGQDTDIGMIVLSKR